MHCGDHVRYYPRCTLLAGCFNLVDDTNTSISDCGFQGYIKVRDVFNYHCLILYDSIDKHILYILNQCIVFFARSDWLLKLGIV